jgi:uncharacterized protein YggE
MTQLDERTGITVTGSGAAVVPVDRVTVMLGISVIRPDAGAAFQAAAVTATRVLAILADDGADARSVRTADLTMGPVSEWRDNREVLTGYSAGQRLIVVLPGLAGLERLLTDVAMGGGEGVRIENLSLTASDVGAAQARARDIAFADALARAGQLAELAGRRLGALHWLEERPEAGSGPHRMFGGAAPMAAAAKMPVATGDSEVAVTVTACWAFAD